LVKYRFGIIAFYSNNAGQIAFAGRHLRPRGKLVRKNCADSSARCAARQRADDEIHARIHDRLQIRRASACSFFLFLPGPRSSLNSMRHSLFGPLTAAALFLQAFTLSAQEKPNRLDLLVKTLDKIPKPDAQATILKGMRDSLQGQRGVPEPKGWAELYPKLQKSPDEQVRAHAQALSVIFGGGAAMDEMRARLADGNAPIEQRRQALDALVAQRDPGALDALLQLAKQPSPLREPALRGLASYDDPRLAKELVAGFAAFDSAERRAAVQTLLARPSGAKAFLDGLDAGAIPKAELTAPVARQLEGLKDPGVTAWLAKNWGAVNPPNADKQKEIAKYKEFLHPDLILRADASRGRALYAQTCAVCHHMHGVGGKIGPELTGGYEDVDYLLNNILDPNALIGKDYQQTFVKTKDGQTVAGIVVEDTDRAVGLKTLGGTVVTVQKSDVASTELSPMSMMPEGLLSAMHEPDVRDLFLYLRQKQQVPMLVTPINANDFFNGSDLTNWRPSNPSAWRVENGEIVGKGGAHPESLTSDMVAGDYRLSVEVLVRGEKGAAEIVLSGQQDAKNFHGTTISFGGPSSVNLWNYRAGAEPQMIPGKRSLGDNAWHKLELVRKDDTLRVTIDGTQEFETRDTRHRRRVHPAFWIHGEAAELRIKSLTIEAL
jgi:putative heme-binding domain-containing protein